MLKKLCVGLAVIASLSSCSDVTAKASPDPLNKDQPTQTPTAQPSTAQAPTTQPSVTQTPIAQAPIAQSTQTPIAQPSQTSNNNQSNSGSSTGVKQDTQNTPAKLQLLKDPEKLYQEFQILNSKLVKNEYEKTEDFNQRAINEKQKFEKKIGFDLHGIFVAVSKSGLEKPQYDADKEVLTINQFGYQSNSIRSGWLTNLKNRGIAYICLSLQVLPDEQAQQGELQDEQAQQGELQEFWLSKKDKFDEPGNIVIPNIEPSYAKELIEQHKLIYVYYFRDPVVSPDGRGVITGKLVNVQVVGGDNEKVLWSLN